MLIDWTGERCVPWAPDIQVPTSTCNVTGGPPHSSTGAGPIVAALSRGDLVGWAAAITGLPIPCSATAGSRCCAA
jgi:hypothetical protein